VSASQATTILHLSDLHFRSDSDRGLSHIDSWDRSLLRDLKDRSIWPDCIVVSGDLTNDGSKIQFRDARAFLERMLDDKLGGRLRPKDVVIVPGNHDIDWSPWRRKFKIGKHGGKKTAQELRKEAFRNYAKFFHAFYKSNRSLSVRKGGIWFTTHWSNKKVFVLGLNSCTVDSPPARGIGYVDIDQLEDAKERFSRIWEDCTTRIAVVHHHLLPVRWTENKPDPKHPSLTLNAERVLQWLVAQNFQVVLHGHQHHAFYGASVRYRVVDVRNRFIRSQIVILGAGSVNRKEDQKGTQDERHYQVLRFSPGRLLVEPRIQHPDQFADFVSDQPLDLALHPGVGSPQVARLLSTMESRSGVHLLSTPRRFGRLSVVRLTREDADKILPSLLQTAGYRYSSAVPVGLLLNAKQDAVLEVISKEGQRGVLQRLVLGRSSKTKSKRIRRKLMQLHNKGAKIRWLNYSTYKTSAQKFARSVAKCMSNLRGGAKEASSALGLGSEKTSAVPMFAILGDSPDLYLLFTLVRSPDSSPRDSVKSKQFQWLIFESPDELVNTAREFWAELWNQAEQFEARHRHSRR
jgi:3',5'-cyclic AMP phosphodiesterase CpdA